jgi:hypothetical protein
MCREPAFRHSRGARGRVSLGFSRRCFWQSRRPQSQLSLGDDIALEHLVPRSRCGNAWHFHYRYSGNDVSRVPKQLSRLRTRAGHSAEHLAGRERRKIGLHLWAKMKPDTMFIVRVSGPGRKIFQKNRPLGAKARKSFGSSRRRARRWG